MPANLVGKKGKNKISIRPYDAASDDESDEEGPSNSSGMFSKGKSTKKDTSMPGSVGPNDYMYKELKKTRWRLILSYNPPLDLL